MREQQRDGYQEYPGERVLKTVEKARDLVRRLRNYFYMPDPKTDWFPVESSLDITEKPPAKSEQSKEGLTPEQIEFLARAADPYQKHSPYL